ncbi:hypothetical protein EON67_09720 [archaeon]|nr:MAG: hypothetical protein EON67_09720 [archaeon]
MQEKLLRGNGKLGTCGVAINPSRFIITVRRLVGMHRDAETGALSRMWSSEKEECTCSIRVLNSRAQCAVLRAASCV